MRHSKNDVRKSEINKFIDCWLKSRNESFTSLKSKSFHCVELLSKEISKQSRPSKSIIILDFLIFWLLMEHWTLNLLSDPCSFFLIEDMEILDSYSLAVSNFKSVNKFSKFPVLFHSKQTLNLRRVEIEFSVKILISESIILVIKSVKLSHIMFSMLFSPRKFERI